MTKNEQLGQLIQKTMMNKEIIVINCEKRLKR